MKKLAPLFALATLSACAYFPYFEGITPGTAENDVIARVGKPTARITLPGGGAGLEYPRQPLGWENYRVVLDGSNRVVRVEQLMDEPHFMRLKPGMTKAEVTGVLGRHSEEAAYRRLDESVLSWRYRELGNRLMFFNAHFDASGRFKYDSRSMDPAELGLDNDSQ
jgi:hypothetical protein